MSKGDIVAEPIEFVVELLIRILLRVVAKSAPENNGSHFGVAEWLWLALALSLFGLLIWWLWRVANKHLFTKSAQPGVPADRLRRPLN